jgi:hypothetical protein
VFVVIGENMDQGLELSPDQTHDTTLQCHPYRCKLSLAKILSLRIAMLPFDRGGAIHNPRHRQACVDVMHELLADRL